MNISAVESPLENRRGQDRSDVTPHTRFALPDELSAHVPPEARGLARDQVRLLIARGSADTPPVETGRDGDIAHARFRDLPDHLSPGDLLVVNTSGTLPAAIDGTRLRDGAPVVAHFSAGRKGWLVELRTAPDAARPVWDGVAGEQVLLGDTGAPAAVTVTLQGAYPHPASDGRNRLWRAHTDARVSEVLTRDGRPIRYGYVPDRWPLESYQTVFATEPGSAEMPSAGRPFTTDLITRLTTAGVLIAPVTLHTGVSSQEAGEPPLAEQFHVPAATASLINWTRRRGRRVIAVGTTVTRALESAASPDGAVSEARGWTDLVLGPGRSARAVDSLITGLHAPDASHLLLLEAIAGPRLVQRAYHAALERGYLWHEFGDVSLLLSDDRARSGLRRLPAPTRRHRQ